MKICLFPGSFDPPTLGHMDIIARCSHLFNKVVVGVLNNNSKRPLFPSEERVDLLKNLYKDCPQIEVQSFSGLTVHLAKQVGAQAIIRGLRSSDDLGYEQTMARLNAQLDGDIETVMLLTDHRYSHISSSMVKEIAYYGGNINDMVDFSIVSRVRSRMIVKRAEDIRINERS